MNSDIYLDFACADSLDLSVHRSKDASIASAVLSAWLNERINQWRASTISCASLLGNRLRVHHGLSRRL
jgi:hypothetical protein